VRINNNAAAEINANKQTLKSINSILLTWNYHKRMMSGTELLNQKS